MTVSGIARVTANTDRYRRQGVTSNLPNGSLPPEDHVNPYCPEGMDTTGRTDFHRIVPVDEDVANRIRVLVFEDMKNDGGMSDGEVESQVIKSYIVSLPPEERAAAGWTLNQANIQEAKRLGEYVHQRDPFWNQGKPVKLGILNEHRQGTDRKAQEKLKAQSGR